MKWKEVARKEHTIVGLLDIDAPTKNWLEKKHDSENR